MKVIFCRDPLNPDSPDSMYVDEVAAATHHGLDIELVDYQQLIDNNAARAVRNIPIHSPPETVIYRGWMLTAEQYGGLYDALYSRGLRLINDIQTYKHCQHLPEIFHLIQEHTPATVWTQGTEDLSDNALQMLLQPFDENPIILRDYVQTQKFHWENACYIPSAADIDAVQSRVQHFLQLQDEQIIGGLVFREFVEFARPCESPADGMPLIQEYRIVYYHQHPIALMRYWDIPDYNSALEPDLHTFDDIAKSIHSDFFTLDVARRADSDHWMIIESGDAQIASLPNNASIEAFYQALVEK